MTRSNGYGWPDKQIPGIIKVCALTDKQSENAAVPKMFTTILQGKNQIW